MTAMSLSSDVEPNVEDVERHKAVKETSEKPAISAEGGRAGWLCVVGSTIGLFCTFGFLAA